MGYYSKYEGFILRFRNMEEEEVEIVVKGRGWEGVLWCNVFRIWNLIIKVRGVILEIFGEEWEEGGRFVGIYV